jgi:hypothetical protein
MKCYGKRTYAGAIGIRKPMSVNFQSSHRPSAPTLPIRPEGPSAPSQWQLSKKATPLDRILAVIDRVLRITDQMREAELVRLGMCALRRQAIR